MAERTYISNRWPFLQLGYAKFENGSFTTSDPNVQKKIQAHDWFGSTIHPKEHYDLDGPEPVELDEAEPIAITQGAVSTLSGRANRPVTGRS